jgi:hypothetical protein
VNRDVLLDWRYFVLAFASAWIRLGWLHKFQEFVVQIPLVRMYNLRTNSQCRNPLFCVCIFYCGT